MSDKQFTLYWRTGDREVVTGKDTADAMNRAGYGGGAARALDFWAKGDNSEYQWNGTDRSWDRLNTPGHSGR